MNHKIERMLGLRGYSPIYSKTDDQSSGGGSEANTEETTEETTEEVKNESSNSEGESNKESDSGKKDQDNEKADLLKEVMKKKEKITNLSTEVNSLKDQLKAFDGINLDEVKQMIKDREDQENKALEAKGEFDRVKQNMNEAHKIEIGNLNDKITELTNKLNLSEGAINDLTIGSAFDSSDFISKEMTLTPSKARIIYGQNFDIVDGKVVGYDKPKGSTDRTQLVDSSGSNLKFEDAIKKLVNDDPDVDSLLLSKMKTGSGSKTDTASLKQPITKVEKRGIDRIASALG